MVDDDHSMISVGFSTPTPWKTPREISEEELGKMIEEMAAKVPDMNKAIFNFHDPPKNSTLDTCPMLDWTKDPPEQIVQGGQPSCTELAVLGPCGRRSKNINQCLGCMDTSMSRNPLRRSDVPPASTREVNMQKGY